MLTCASCGCFWKSAALNIRWIPIFASRRTYTKDVKKFYKTVSISQADGGYEVNLDKRKLKTPLGKLFQVPSEALALAVAQEWNSQKEFIKRHSMHLNLLCNTAIDNPTQRPRDVVIRGILEYLDTDTVCYHLDEPIELAELQTKEWGSLIDWVKHRYNVELEPTTGIGVPTISQQATDVFRQHLLSHNDWALVGYQNAVEVVKSFIITSALVDCHITVEQAVYLSRLEQEFQIKRWGNIPWHHDVDMMEVRARLAAATLFVHLNSESHSSKDKLSAPGR